MVRALESELAAEKAKTSKLAQELALLQQQVAPLSSRRVAMTSSEAEAASPSAAAAAATGSKRAKTVRGKAVKKEEGAGGEEQGPSGAAEDVKLEQAAEKLKRRAGSKRKAVEVEAGARREAAADKPVATRSSSRHQK